MELHNINEFYNANINFTFVDDNDRPFDGQDKDVSEMSLEELMQSSGELKGYSEVGEGFFSSDLCEQGDTVPFSDTAEMTDSAPHVVETAVLVEGLVDAEGNELAPRYLGDVLDEVGGWSNLPDDLTFIREEQYGDGRIAHVADGHVAEREGQRALYLSLDVINRPYGEMEFYKKLREQRFHKMAVWALRCKNINTLRRARNKWYSKYKQTVKSCVKTKNWWAMYLTRDQIGELWEIVDDRISQLK